MLRLLPLATRHPEKPVLMARDGSTYWWESLGVFNPAVAEYHDKIVLLYRAYDQSRISRLGLAHSQDGINFTRYHHPVIDTDPDDPYERIGIEDPRITKIDDVYYIIHTSASYERVKGTEVVGEDIPWRVRVGMHTTKDFKSYAHWSVILPNISAKNAMLLPEKREGAFCMYYREFTATGEILKITYTHDFVKWFNTTTIEWPQRLAWQGLKVGFGSQPIIVSDGYLMVYHAVDPQHVYRLGLVLFDRHDPSKIVWYSDKILEPEMPYEKVGYVPNVVYSCGALIRNDELWIYYGGADQVIGRATMPMSAIFA